jgi:hypothetical protein
MDLKVIEPIEKPLKSFSTVDEFNLFYSKNKEAIDKETTHKLNRQYYIEGYRITKIKGVLSLKKWDESRKYYKSKKDLETETETETTKLSEHVNELLNDVDNLNEKVIELTKLYSVEIPEIKLRINEIIETLDKLYTPSV